MPYDDYSLDDEDEKDRIYREAYPELVGDTTRQIIAGLTPSIQQAASTLGAPPPIAAPAVVAVQATPAAPQHTAPEPEQAGAVRGVDMLAAQAEHDALEKRRTDAERDAISLAARGTPGGGGGGPAFGEWLGDNAVGLFGTFLDAALNKGRNIPTVLTLNAQAQAQAQAARAKQQSADDDFALRAQGQRLEDMRRRDAAGREDAYKAALVKHWGAQEAAQRQGLGLRERGMTLRELRADIETNPNNAAVAELKEGFY